MVRPFSNEEKENIRKEIIKLAKTLLMEKTFEEVKVLDITRKVGISKGSFYSFFESKEILLAEVLMDLEREIHQEIVSLLQENKSSKEKLKEVLFVAFKKAKENKLLQSILSKEGNKSLYKNIPKEMVQSFIEIDIDLLNSVIGPVTELKVDMNLAIDLLRSIFYLQNFSDEIQTDLDKFNRVLIDIIVEKIIK